MGAKLWEGVVRLGVNPYGLHTFCPLLERGGLCGLVWMTFPKQILLLTGTQRGPLSEVSLLPHDKQWTPYRLLGTCLLLCRAGLSTASPSDAAPRSAEVGDGGVSVDCYVLLNFISLSYVWREWTWNMTCILLLCSEPPGLVHTYV